MIRRFGFLDRPVDGATFHTERRKREASCRFVGFWPLCRLASSSRSPRGLAQRRSATTTTRRSRSDRAEQADVERCARRSGRCASTAGTQPAPDRHPGDVGFRIISSRAQDGVTYSPVHASTSTRRKLSGPALPSTCGSSTRTRRRRRPRRRLPPAAQGNNNRNSNNRNQPPPRQPARRSRWDNVHFLDVPADGKLSRAIAAASRATTSCSSRVKEKVDVAARPEGRAAAPPLKVGPAAPAT